MSLEEDLAIAKRWKQKAEQIENSRRKVLKKRALRNEDIANNNYFSEDVAKAVKKYPILKKLLGVPFSAVSSAVYPTIDKLKDISSGQGGRVSKVDAKEMMKAASEIVRNVDAFKSPKDKKQINASGVIEKLLDEKITLSDSRVDEEEKKIRDRRAKQQRDSKMNRGGLTKKGNVDYRKTGMFYGGMVKKKK